MADDKRPDVFGDGSTGEQQDRLIKEHDEINKQLHEAAKAQREQSGDQPATPVQAEPPKPAQSAQAEPKAKDRQSAG